MSDKSRKSGSFLIERLWGAYEGVDTRRRRGFYLLFTATVVFGLLWVTRPAQFVLPIINTEVTLFAAMAVGPAFLLAFSGSYYYLCCHTISTYIRWLDRYQDVHSEAIESLGLSFEDLYASARQRDVTEAMNIFLIFTAASPTNNYPLPKLVRILKDLTANFLRILTVVAPLSVYLGISHWIWVNYGTNVSRQVAFGMVGFYYLMAPSFILALTYCYYRVKPFRDRLNQQKRV